jgi:acyl-CoA synthetase (AMP-forming)/AMP-acid ligase II/acyl carrier protein
MPSVETEVAGIAKSIDGILAAQADRFSDVPALLAEDKSSITFGSLHAQVKSFHAALRAAGVGAGDRVAIVLPNGPGMAVTFLAVASAATCAPLNPAYAAPEFEFYLDDLDARAVIVPANWESPVREVARKRGIAILELTSRVSEGDLTFALAGFEDVAPLEGESTSPDAIALILHTSGTTARPKMIRLTQANLCASAANIRRTLQLGPSDRCLNVMPLFHIHGLMAALLSSLSSGASVVCTPGFTPARFYEWLDAFRPTWYTAVPSMHQEVLARAAANEDVLSRCTLRFVRSSSAALPPNVMSDLERIFAAPVLQALGMTEASHQIASNPLPPAARKAGCVGLPTCEVAILDENDQQLPQGSAGEIAIRGANVTTIKPSPGRELTPRGAGEWFRTGDVGYVDEDGYLFLSGRIKEMINRGGEKIAPGEVDYVLLAHPDVAQAVCCAVPDARLGEDVIAIVVRRPDKTVTERELREFASKQIAPFKVPRRILFMEQIPKGPTGKIQRIGLAKRLGIESLAFTQPGASAPFAAPATATESVIAGMWAEVLGVDAVGRQDNFFELGGDSLMAADIIVRMEKEFGARVDIREMGFGTLQQVAAECDRTATDAVKAPAEQSRGGWLRRILGREVAR